MLGSKSQLLVLVRHGQAKSTEEDPTRQLNLIGRQQAESMSNWFARLGPKVDEVWHSGKPRARQTAEILARGLGLAPARVRKVAGLSPAESHLMVARHLEEAEEWRESVNAYIASAAGVCTVRLEERNDSFFDSCHHFMFLRLYMMFRGF